MTLRQQLLVGITSVFTLIFLGLFIENIYSTRTYVEKQLATHAQDAATALTFPLSRALAKDDLVLAETTIAAMSDRGYFQSITVYSVDGTLLVQRSMPTHIEGVPSWFVSLTHLDPPPGQSLLSGGWRQLGRVVVMSQPVLAYRQLWYWTLTTLAWLVMVYVGALLLVFMLLRIILSPLHAIEIAAKAIANKRFEPIMLRPRAREFKQVVQSLNDMIKRIASFLNIEEKRAEGFRKDAYQDLVTTLENRRSFDLRLGQLLSAEGGFKNGALFAIVLDRLKEFNIERGYQVGDELLVALAGAFRTVFGTQATVLSRIGGASIAAVVLDQPDSDIVSLANQLQKAVSEVVTSFGVTLPYGIGVALFYHGETAHQLLTRLDLATETARYFGGNHLQIRKPSRSASEGLGSMAWRQLILKALAQSRWVLYAQPVLSFTDNRVIHSEVVARLAVKGGELIPARQFLPMAARHQLLLDVEKALLNAAVDILVTHQDGLALALNISFDGLLSDPNTLSQLAERIRITSRWGKSRPLLSLEVSEFHFLSHFDRAKAVIAQMRALGCQFGIDQFGFDSRALNAIRHMPPDYIKLDGGLVRDIVDNKSARELVRSIVQVAHSLGISVFAQGVEVEEVVSLLRNIGLDGGQGFYFGYPNPL